ncbi:MAG: hypothetical protein ACTHNU_13130 [Gaiellales bacterium]
MEQVPRWAIIPGVLACIALLAGGAWAGITLGNGSSSTVTDTIHVVRSGHVVVVSGVRKVALPASTVTRNGRVIHLPAQLVTLTNNQVQTSVSTAPGRTVVRTGRTSTVTVPGPTQTVTQVSSVTETVTETEPGTTITVTVTQTT